MSESLLGVGERQKRKIKRKQRGKEKETKVKRFIMNFSDEEFLV